MPRHMAERLHRAALTRDFVESGKMATRFSLPREAISDFCRRNHIRRLALFGSALRDDFRPDSDVDLLVEFYPEHVPGFFELYDMEEELSLVLGGRKVDLRTPQDLSRYFRDKVIARAEVQYAAE
jgi:predicted nucleotidyltransferase